jgi:hypothetical protein
MQLQGIGRLLLKPAAERARSLLSDAIRIDAVDGDAGAGPHYSECGFGEVGRATYRKTRLICFEFVF